MDTKETRTLCLKQIYGAVLTEADQRLVDDYKQTADGRDYLRECREVKDLLKNVADIKLKPVDHEMMIKNFERTARQTFQQTVFRPWWEANSPPIILGLLAVLLIALNGWNVVNAILLGSCSLWMTADYFQRHYFAKVLSRPDLYEYAKASRSRSDRILQSLPGLTLVVLFSVLPIAAVTYGAYLGYLEFGFFVPALVIYILVETVAIFIYQNRKLKRSNREVWDWWAEEIKE